MPQYYRATTNPVDTRRRFNVVLTLKRCRVSTGKDIMIIMISVSIATTNIFIIYGFLENSNSIKISY